jgi:PGF-CTERM protein
MTGTTTAMHGRFLAVVIAVVVLCSVMMGPIAGATGAARGNTVTINSVTIQTAPNASFDHLDTSNVSEFATKDTEIAAGDVLIFRLSTAGLSDAFEENSTDRRFLELVQSGVIDLRISQIGTVSKTFNLSATIENGGLSVFYEENTLYIAIDTGRAVFDQGRTTVGVEPGARFRATFTGNRSNGTGAVSSEFRIVPRRATFETDNNGTVVVEADANQTVSGTTTVAPGTDLTIRARSEGQSSFVITQTVQVVKGGEFESDFDFTNVTRGISFELTIPGQGFENNASTPGVVRRPPTASVRVNTQQSRNGSVQRVTIRSATLSDGGFLAVYDSSLLTNDNVTASAKSLRGASEYLTSGEHAPVNITLDRPYTYNGTIIVIPHQDTNNNGKYEFITSNGSEDSPYLGADGDPIVASANVTVNQYQLGETTGTGSDDALPETTSGVMATTATSGENGTRMTSEDSDGSDPNGNTKSGSGTGDTTAPRQQPATNPQDMTTEALGPGFGFIVGLVALCVAALLAIRRDG